LAASHGRIGLLSVAPMTSLRVWIDGMVFRIVFGWISAIVLGSVYTLKGAGVHTPTYAKPATARQPSRAICRGGANGTTSFFRKMPDRRKAADTS
jgi:hypothetical protein